MGLSITYVRSVPGKEHFFHRDISISWIPNHAKILFLRIELSRVPRYLVPPLYLVPGTTGRHEEIIPGDQLY